jgi:hypothetical protein
MPDLSKDRISDYVFRLGEECSHSMEIQHRTFRNAYVRLQSIFRKSGAGEVAPSTFSAARDAATKISLANKPPATFFARSD